MRNHTYYGWLHSGARLHYAPPKNLKCPFCGAEEWQRLESWSEGLEVVIFKCGFSVTFKMHTLEREKERLMQEAKKSGKFQKWIESKEFEVLSS